MKTNTKVLRCIIFLLVNMILVWDCEAQVLTSSRTISGDGIHIEVYEKDIYNNTYIAGGTYGSSFLTYDTTNFAIGYSNLFICKIDSAGSLMWINFYPVSEFSKFFNVVVDSVGNIYACGTFHGFLILDSANVFNSLSNSQDGILMKLDSSGDLIWCKASYSQGNSGFFNPILDNGNLYISNQYSPELSFDTLFVVGDQIGQNTVILKLDTSGNILTSQNLINGTIADIQRGVSGNLYLTGTSYIDMYLDSIQLPFQGPGWSNIYLMKLDSNLNFLNHRIASYPLVQYYWNSQPRFVLTLDERIYLGGYFDSLSVVGDSVLNTASNLGDVFLASFDSSFNSLWSRKFGDVEQDLLYNLELTQSGNLILCTGFNNSTVFDGFSLSSLHGLTMLLSSLDSTGNVLWTKFNQQGFTGPIARIVEFDNKISLLGLFSDTITWDSYYETNGGYFILEFEDINSSSIGMDLQQNELVLYPNPTAGSITLSNFNDQTELLVLYDLTGKVLLSKQLNSESSMLFPNLEDGVYLICAFDRSMKLQSRKKLIVCKQ